MEGLWIELMEAARIKEFAAEVTIDSTLFQTGRFHQGVEGAAFVAMLIEDGGAASTIFLRVCSPLVIHLLRTDHPRPIGPFSS